MAERAEEEANEIITCTLLIIGKEKSINNMLRLQKTRKNQYTNFDINNHQWQMDFLITTNLCIIVPKCLHLCNQLKILRPTLHPLNGPNFTFSDGWSFLM